jgi:hypothetical protein
MRDMHSNVKAVIAITPQAVGTTGAANGKLSAILDRRGYDSVEFVYSSGTSATVADTITPVILEAAATGDSFTSVAADDLVGTEAAITLTAAAAKQVGYRGNKRYLKIRLYGTGTATAVVSANMLLGNPERAPVA